jgi:hypothetical protein
MPAAIHTQEQKGTDTYIDRLRRAIRTGRQTKGDTHRHIDIDIDIDIDLLARTETGRKGQLGIYVERKQRHTGRQ